VDLYSTYHLKTSNALVTLVKAKEDCLKKLPKAIKLHAGSMSSSGNEFQTIRTAIEKARPP